jgi:hypothetical protein
MFYDRQSIMHFDAQITTALSAPAGDTMKGDQISDALRLATAADIPS